MNSQSIKKWIDNYSYFTSVVVLCIICMVTIVTLTITLLIQHGILTSVLFISIIFITIFIIIKQASKRVKSVSQWMAGTQ